MPVCSKPNRGFCLRFSIEKSVNRQREEGWFFSFFPSQFPVKVFLRELW